jgi:hypothetical protein
MANIVKHDPSDKNANEFINLLKNQDFIDEIYSPEDYSNESLYNDVCKILKKAKYLNDKSLFKTVINFLVLHLKF